jgi:hypothetical protein
MNISHATSAFAGSDQSTVFILVSVFNDGSLISDGQTRGIHGDSRNHIFTTYSTHAGGVCPARIRVRGRLRLLGRNICCLWFIRGRKATRYEVLHFFDRAFKVGTGEERASAAQMSAMASFAR